MLDDVFRELHEVVSDITKMADSRRRITALDPVADTMLYCAALLDTKLRDLESGLQWLSVDQYADDVGISPQSVRAWCRKGELQAERTPNGWRIRRGATRKRKERAA